MEELTTQLKKNLYKPFYNWSMDLLGGKMYSMTTDDYLCVRFLDGRIPTVNHDAFYYVDYNRSSIVAISDRQEDATMITPTRVDTVFKNSPLMMNIQFEKSLHRVHAKLIASKIERPHAFSWAAGLVKEWTVSPSKMVLRIDYRKAERDIDKYLPNFIDEINSRIHLNTIYMNYKTEIRLWKN